MGVFPRGRGTATASAAAVGLCLVLPLGCAVPPDDGVAGGQGEPSSAEAAKEPEGQGGASAAPEEGGEEGWPWGEGDGSPRREAAQGETEGGSAEAARREVNRLAQQGREALRAEEYQRAAERFEQALDRDARRGVLWQNLAAVRHKQGRHRRAEQLALRAAELAGEDPALLRESWWLIAAARLEQGDRRGAREAAQMARRFEEAGGPRVGALPPEQ